MHIPNGLLDTPTCVATSTIAATTLGYAAWRAKSEITRNRAALMAMAGIGVFAIQALNFPLTAHTSGHMLGAVAAGALLGPWCGMLAIAIVLAVQCFVLGDGGLSALGANTLNMAILGALAGHLAIRSSNRSMVSKVTAVGVASFAAVSLGGVACAAQFAASGTFGFAEVLTAMMPVQMLLAVAEGVFTAGLVAAVLRQRALNPEPLAKTDWISAKTVGAMALACVAIVAALPLASQLPDTLEAAIVVLDSSVF